MLHRHRAGHCRRRPAAAELPDVGKPHSEAGEARESCKIEQRSGRLAKPLADKRFSALSKPHKAGIFRYNETLT